MKNDIKNLNKKIESLTEIIEYQRVINRGYDEKITSLNHRHKTLREIDMRLSENNRLLSTRIDRQDKMIYDYMTNQANFQKKIKLIVDRLSVIEKKIKILNGR